jgi:hypothetical protein
MNYLDTTTRKLEIQGAGAKTTNDCPWVCSYRIAASGAAITPPATATGTTNGTAVVQLIPSPASGVVYDLISLSVFNADTAAFTVSIRFNDNSTIYKTQTFTLSIGDNLLFSGGEFYIIDANGNKK